MCISIRLRFTSKSKVMGNCIRLRRHESSSSLSMVRADDDDHDDEGWDSSGATKKSIIPEKLGLLVEHDKGKGESTSGLSSSIHNKEIKIKISKKQLEQLLGEAKVHELRGDQVLSRLINVSNHQQICQMLNDQRSWRPRLQSIPEVN